MTSPDDVFSLHAPVWRYVTAREVILAVDVINSHIIQSKFTSLVVYQGSVGLVQLGLMGKRQAILGHGLWANFNMKRDIAFERDDIT